MFGKKQRQIREAEKEEDRRKKKEEAEEGKKYKNVVAYSKQESFQE